MLKIGITGGIGSGKSTVSQLLKIMGIPVYIADDESKKLTATSPIIKIKLIQAFGEEIYKGNSLNKKLLASYIFNDKKKLEKANSIIHPEVEKHYLNWLDIHASYPIVAQESAILYESGFNRFSDKIIMVYSPLETRIQRSISRENTSREKVLERIHSQMPDEEKASLADYIIYNDESRSLISQLFKILDSLNN